MPLFTQCFKVQQYNDNFNDVIIFDIKLNINNKVLNYYFITMH